MSDLISRLRIITFLIFLPTLITGCLSTGYQRHYQGDLKPLSDVAIIVQMENPATSFIDYVDGKDTHTSLNKGFGRLAVTGLIELTPGKHIICAGFQKYMGSSIYRGSRGCSEIVLNAKPGHIYFLYPRFNTHKVSWKPVFWDITRDLHTTELKKLTEEIDNIFAENRGGKTKSILSIGTKKNTSPLTGFGEELKSNLKRWLNKDISVPYQFNRYVPYIVAEANNGIEYHLEIDQKTGIVINVFGKNIDVNSGIENIQAFQPLNSKIAYQTVYRGRGNYTVKWKEQKNGSFKKVK